MVKQKQKQNNKSKAKKPPTQKRTKRRTVMGPVSTINTAPVAIGNSLSGSSPVITQGSNGARVVGRDFAFAAGATVSAITSWEMIGGLPLTPVVFTSSVLRNFSQIYNEFKFNRIAIHYITSSPTTQAGDIMFYYERDRSSPGIDYTNNGFLNYVMSDKYTVLGPQWTNHTAFIVPESGFKTTNFALTSDLKDDNQGSVVLFSKTNAANSPGYILIDYDITFKSLAVTPRAGLFPIVRGVSSMICLTATALATTVSVTSVTGLALTTGKILDGTTSALPSGAKNGDIYKFVAAATNSTASGVNSAWTTVTLANLLVDPDSRDVLTPVDDGFTMYLKVWDETAGSGITSTGSLHPTLECAATNTKTFLYGVTGTITFNLVGWITLVHSTNYNTLQSTY